MNANRRKSIENIKEQVAALVGQIDDLKSEI